MGREDLDVVLPVVPPVDVKKCRTCGKLRLISDFTKTSRKGNIRVLLSCEPCRDEATRLTRMRKRKDLWTYVLRDGARKDLYAKLPLEWGKYRLELQRGRCYWTGQVLLTDLAQTDDPRFVSVDCLDVEPRAVHTVDNCVLSTRLINLGRNNYKGDFVAVLRGRE